MIRKGFLKSKYGVFVPLIFLFSFISCKNLITSSDLQEYLQKSIDYVNSPYANITIISEGLETASLIPAAGTYTDKYKATDSFEIKFQVQNAYCFTEWSVIPEGAVTFENTKDSYTKVTVVNVSEPITISPKTSVRPRIVSVSPQDSFDGVYRDRTIVVKFNTEMLESSIYWSAEELKELGVDLSKAFKVDSSVSDENALYYAYWDGSNPSSYCYKNIKITKYTDSSANLLQYYGIPMFDPGNTRLLRIPTNMNSAPPSVTEILVTIKKDFSSEQDEIKISLSDDYQWSYYTNGNTDNDIPEFVTNDNNNKFVVTVTDIGEQNQNAYKDTNEHVKERKDDFSDIEICKKLNIKNKKLWVRGSFTDTGSGPGSLKWEVYKVNTDLYPCTTENVLIQQNQIKLTINGSTASVNPCYGEGSSFDKGGQIIEIDNLNKEGVYRIDFLASDKNTRTAKKSFYFLYDIEPPPASTVTYVSTQAKDIITVHKDDNTHFSYYQTDISGVIFNNDTSGSGSGTTKEIGNLGTDTRKHTITIKDYDYYGNCRITTKQIDAEAQVGYIFYDDCYWSSIDKLEDAIVTGRNPVGIILGAANEKATNSFTDKAKIIAIERDTEARFVITDDWSYDFPWGWNGEDHTDKDGLTNYYKVINNTKGAITHSEVYQYLYETKNNYNKNKIIWYLPAINEYLYINGHFAERRNEFVSQLAILKNKGYTTLSNYAYDPNNIDNSISESLISSTISHDNNKWSIVCAGMKMDNTSQRFYQFAKIDQQDFKVKSLYMAQVDLD